MQSNCRTFIALVTSNLVLWKVFFFGFEVCVVVGRCDIWQALSFWCCNGVIGVTILRVGGSTCQLRSCDDVDVVQQIALKYWLTACPEIRWSLTSWGWYSVSDIPFFTRGFSTIPGGWGSRGDFWSNSIEYVAGAFSWCRVPRGEQTLGGLNGGGSYTVLRLNIQKTGCWCLV